MNEKQVKIRINGSEHTIGAGLTVAAALLECGVTNFRRPVGGEHRSPLCGMGICFECRATIDGIAHTRTCMTLARDGIDIRTD